MATPDHSIIIVGAGLAGLHVAWRLEKAGCDYLLLEARQAAGGRIGSTSAGGTDLGPTWFWPHQPLTGELLEELGLTRFSQRTEGDVLYQAAPGQAPTRHPGAGSPLSYRVSGGMMAIVEALLQRIDGRRLRLEHAVRGAQRIDDQWLLTVEHTGGSDELRATRLIAALPPRLLLRDLEATQWASPELRAALASQQTWMSAQAKFVAEFPEAFWREQGLSGDAFSRTGPMVEIHDASDESTGVAALFGFVGVPASARYDINPSELEAACARQLVQLFGEAAAEPSHIELRDWAKEEFTSTESDIGEQPAHADFPLTTHQQELDTLELLVAGSEFARENPGYLEGALEASNNSVDRILEMKRA